MCIDSTGVISMAVEGSDKDHLVVIGEDVDSAKDLFFSLSFRYIRSYNHLVIANIVFIFDIYI